MSEHDDMSQRWVGLAMVHRSVLPRRAARAVDAQAWSADSHEPLQRPCFGESGAERVEREIASVEASDSRDDLVEVDIDELTERVYQLFADQLVRERDRAAWVG